MTKEAFFTKYANKGIILPTEALRLNLINVVKAFGYDLAEMFVSTDGPEVLRAFDKSGFSRYHRRSLSRLDEWLKEENPWVPLTGVVVYEETTPDVPTKRVFYLKKEDERYGFTHPAGTILLTRAEIRPYAVGEYAWYATTDFSGYLLVVGDNEPFKIRPWGFQETWTFVGFVDIPVTEDPVGMTVEGITLSKAVTPSFVGLRTADHPFLVGDFVSHRSENDVKWVVESEDLKAKSYKLVVVESSIGLWHKGETYTEAFSNRSFHLFPVAPTPVTPTREPHYEGGYGPYRYFIGDKVVVTAPLYGWENKVVTIKDYVHPCGNISYTVVGESSFNPIRDSQIIRLADDKPVEKPVEKPAEKITEYVYNGKTFHVGDVVTIFKGATPSTINDIHKSVHKFDDKMRFSDENGSNWVFDGVDIVKPATVAVYRATKTQEGVPAGARLMEKKDIPVYLQNKHKGWLAEKSDYYRFAVFSNGEHLTSYSEKDYETVELSVDDVPKFGEVVGTVAAVKTPLNGLAYRYADRKAFVRKFPKSGAYAVAFASNDEVEYFVEYALKYGYKKDTGNYTPTTNDQIRHAEGKILLFVDNGRITGWNPLNSPLGQKVIQYAAKEHRVPYYTGK